MRREDLRQAKVSSAEHAQGPFPEHGTRGWQIVHLAGMEQAKDVRAAYEAWPEITVKVIDYCDDMASVWAVADGAIARAGASTCAELTACGVPAILLPYPFHKDLHQKANAMELVRAGAALIVDDAKEAAANAAAMKPALESLLYDDELRDRMADAARAAGKPNAAVEIAKEILGLTAGSLR
jgi:UDP-N-acetylglucosamine--N-acetylmuramyl-(pentapeptide) pyrophosphoryl-undecaprenol N-acetylglucosamine transferase